MRKIKDPEYTELTSVIEVSVTSDLDYANIILSIFSTNEEKRIKTFNAIKRASGFLRHELSQKMRVRKTPELKFHLDRSSEYSAHINSILEGLNIKKENNED